jgi:perosamine synthetase
MIRIPVYQPSLTGREREYVDECLDTGWISSKGPFVGRFEEAFARRLGVAHAATVCNGTVALHLALLALGIGEGDEVIVPTFTYIASVNAITYVGATPIFVDSLPDTMQMDPDDVRRKLSARTRAVMVVHLYGHACDLDEIGALAAEHNLYVVEDCAEAFGTLYRDRPVGTFGHVAAFSFFGNKTITTGEGGMVVCHAESLHERVVHLKGQGLARYREYWHDIIGFNFRMTNICAAIGLAQLEQADRFLLAKEAVAEGYARGLQGLDQVSLHGTRPYVRSSHWMVTLLTARSEDRDPLRACLAEKGIETRPTFSPVHLMPPYGARYQQHAVAEDLGRRGMNLPSHPALESGQVDEICSHIRAYYARTAR